VVYLTLSEDIMNLMGAGRMPIQAIADFNLGLLARMFGRVVLALIALAIFDYLFQRWNLEQKIKMTKQELKDEMKQTEGDPHLRARVRQIQREMSQARMMENVPKADVVVTNPTHFSVALFYDREAMNAPRLEAKGADHLALRIRQVAEENGVPIVQNPPLTRELYRRVEIGQEVPEDLFRAVAEVLAYVYRLKNKIPHPPNQAQQMQQPQANQDDAPPGADA